MKQKLTIIKKTTEELLKLMSIEGKVIVEEDSLNEAYKIQIETEEPGLLIGYHGQTISALQQILSMIITKKVDSWTRVFVNVGDYREKREEMLRKMALQAAQKVHFSGMPVVLTSLTPGERRIVHMVLSQQSDVETYSEGEGKERRLIVKPKS